jgi:hypothetical protein
MKLLQRMIMFVLRESPAQKAPEAVEHFQVPSGWLGWGKWWWRMDLGGEKDVQCDLALDSDEAGGQDGGE